jgi:ATP-dependent DNA helicase RecG
MEAMSPAAQFAWLCSPSPRTLASWSVLMRADELLAQEEGKRLDFKRNLSSLEPVLRDIVAFANSAGGTVVLGVLDQKKAPGKAASERVEGLSDPLADEEKLMDSIAHSIAPQIRVEISGTTWEEKSLLIVQVPRQLGPVHLKAKGEVGGTYIRLGSTNRLADPARLRELRDVAQTQTWDERAHGMATRGDLDDELAKRIFDAQDAGRVTDAVLRTNRLLVGDPENLHPSNAGLILFAKDPVEHFPDARFRCIAYPSDEKGTRAQDDVNFEDQTVMDALDDVISYIRDHTGTARDIEGMTRRDIPKFSEVMLREILVNAIAHADYNLTGAPLRVSIYPGRLEIQNPGTFPPGMSLEDLKDGLSMVRNRAIAKTLNRLRFMEQQGTAWARIQEAVAEGYPEPEWREAGPTMIVTLFPHSEFTPSLQAQTDGVMGKNDGVPESEGLPGRATKVRQRRARVLSLIDEREPVRIPVISEELGVPAPTLERDLAALTKADFVWFEGSPRSGGYRLKR